MFIAFNKIFMSTLLFKIAGSAAGCLTVEECMNIPLFGKVD
ncbi:hypothetical protein PNIG_b0303 [Pseudoalteromonas nigrifaciens]|uniref:Uncharacterized protein n=1 Tax=Pseudoalteromonas nigrifaciens TaxID=28109 RepID=A0AAC9UL98_9GAMM|nr:hypothetical protein PNIG_b0303 [Pseudoalteromonas nigrifaciens]SJN43499.1 hypothetical protein CZ797_11590 [Pseudoalteromonas sp. JB197]